MPKDFKPPIKKTIFSTLFELNFCPAALALLVCLSLVETSCTQISLTKKTRHNLISDSTNTEALSATNPSVKAVDLSGEWTIGFRLRGTTTSGAMWLKQNGQNFYGYGKDNESGLAFKIERGTINGNEIIFLKRYEKDPAPPVQYHGQFSLLPGDNGPTPYMGGEFARETSSNVLAGDWEAAKKLPEATEAVKEAPAAEVAVSAPPPTENVISRTPDLSGKWEAAFEYNFKIIHSTMFLEQEGSHLNGHGIDKETGGKFVIKRGWYNFPHLSLTREYIASKKGSHIVPAHEMTFKADVSIVKDNDYQGPYLNGKTQGGGSWEAQRDN